MSDTYLDIRLNLNTGELSTQARSIFSDYDLDDHPKLYYNDCSWCLYVGYIKVPLRTSTLTEEMKAEIKLLIEEEYSRLKQAFSFQLNISNIEVKDNIFNPNIRGDMA